MQISRSVLFILACLGAMSLLVSAAAASPQLSSSTPTALSPPAALTSAPQLTPAQIIAKADAWFNSAKTMQCDFMQLGPNGQRTHGVLYVDRPGRLRFEYASPATLSIIADGTSVAIRDRKLATQNEYFISQTPLKFLLDDPIDLAKDTQITGVQSAPDAVSIFLQDKTTFGGTSKIRLIFDPKTFELRQWTVVDPQGYQTLVSLFHIVLNEKPDPQLFHIMRIAHDDE